jgi:hypothetical protein
MLMRVLHAAKLANSQALAFKLQLLPAHHIALARFQAAGSVFVGLRHGPVRAISSLVAMSSSAELATENEALSAMNT